MARLMVTVWSQTRRRYCVQLEEEEIKVAKEDPYELDIWSILSDIPREEYDQELSYEEEIEEAQLEED